MPWPVPAICGFLLPDAHRHFNLERIPGSCHGIQVQRFNDGDGDGLSDVSPSLQEGDHSPGVPRFGGKGTLAPFLLSSPVGDKLRPGQFFLHRDFLFIYAS